MDYANKYKTVFDNAKSKKNFLNQVVIHFKTSMFEEKRSSIHLDINKKDGRNVVIVPKAKDNIKLEILPFAGIYDVIMKLHVENDHKIPDDMKKSTDLKYQIPSICFDIIPRSCNVCRGKADKTGASKHGIVSFIHNMKVESTYYNTILIYLDEYTEYVVLRPSRYGNVVDITTELFKIFMQFGPPKRVCITLKEIAYLNSIKALMTKLCPTCEITFQYNESDQAVLFHVMQAIGSWMKETDSVSWELGCSIVQHQINTTPKQIRPPGLIPVTAHNLFFNHSSVFDADIDEEPLIFVQKKNVVDAEDPLYVAVGKLNIQSKGTRKSKRLQNDQDKSNEAEVIGESDSKAKRKTKSNKNQIKEIEKPSEEAMLEEDPIQIKHEVFIEINKVHDTKSIDGTDEDISTKQLIEEIEDDGEIMDEDKIDIDFGADI